MGVTVRQHEVIVLLFDVLSPRSGRQRMLRGRELIDRTAMYRVNRKTKKLVWIFLLPNLGIRI